MNTMQSRSRWRTACGAVMLVGVLFALVGCGSSSTKQESIAFEDAVGVIPVATATVIPAPTAVRTATATPEPTAIPEPTATVIPSPTAEVVSEPEERSAFSVGDTTVAPGEVGAVPGDDAPIPQDSPMDEVEVPLDADQVVDSIFASGFDMDPYCAKVTSTPQVVGRSFMGTPEHLEQLASAALLAPPEIQPTFELLISHTVENVTPYVADFDDPNYVQTPEFADDPANHQNVPWELRRRIGVTMEVDEVFCGSVIPEGFVFDTSDTAWQSQHEAARAAAVSLGLRSSGYKTPENTVLQDLCGHLISADNVDAIGADNYAAEMRARLPVDSPYEAIADMLEIGQIGAQQLCPDVLEEFTERTGVTSLRDLALPRPGI